MNFKPWSNISARLTVVLIPLFCALFFFACKPNPKPSAKGGTPQEGLASAFDASPTLVFSAKTGAEFASIKGNEQVVLTPSENGLKIVSSGDDPAAHPGNYVIESITARAISSSATP